MPTGYTAYVVDGTIIDLRAFALLCARGMGALITMRDEPMDVPIPDKFEPSQYNAKKLSLAQAERDHLYSLSDDEAGKLAAEEFEGECAARDAWLESKRLGRERYMAMISKVEAWQRAPEGLKEFMLDQLRKGMKFDCPEGDRYWKEVVLLDGASWRRANLERVQQDIEYHTSEHAKEISRTEARNAWIAQLRKSLDEAEADIAPCQAVQRG